MALCTGNQCTAPPPPPANPIVQHGSPNRGELYKVCAAMKHPFLEQIQRSGLSVKTYASTAIEDARSQFSQNPWRSGTKPCIVAQGPTDVDDLRIYLIRVFTPDMIASLPSIVRHYLIPIHDLYDGPSSWVNQHSAFREHIHTSPSWAEGANHWVLGLACNAEETAMGRRCVRKPTNSPLDGSHYFIDLATMQKLEDVCASKNDEWSMKPRQEREDGARQLSTWKTVPKPKNKRLARQTERTPIRGSGGTAPDTYTVHLTSFEQDKMNAVSRSYAGYL
ncbi:hypothetical protein HWV62_451 [Athelia sp. TMB]|nr:hypothetical protein HWV62_451 [Athelia sp. TMB]